MQILFDVKSGRYIAGFLQLISQKSINWYKKARNFWDCHIWFRFCCGPDMCWADKHLWTYNEIPGSSNWLQSYMFGDDRSVADSSKEDSLKVAREACGTIIL